MEFFGVEALGLGGALAALVLGLVLWRLFKLALKVVVFVVGAALVALVVVLAVQNGGASLPLPAVPAPAAP